MACRLLLKSSQLPQLHSLSENETVFQRLLQAVKEHMELPLPRRGGVSKRNRKRKRGEAEPVLSPSTSSQFPPTSHAKEKGNVRLGLNSVLRGVEEDKLNVAVFDAALVSGPISTYLGALANRHPNCLCFAVGNMSSKLSPKIGLNSLAALGLLDDSAQADLRSIVKKSEVEKQESSVFAPTAVIPVRKDKKRKRSKR